MYFKPSLKKTERKEMQFPDEAQLTSATLETAGTNPEALLPFRGRRDGLQVLIDSVMREVEGVGDGRHGLEADEVFARRCVHHGNREFRAVAYRNRLPGALD